MPWCPVCKNEYKEGYTHCNDCDVDLVDSLEEGPVAVIFGEKEPIQAMADFLHANAMEEAFVRGDDKEVAYELYVPRECESQAKTLLNVYIKEIARKEQAKTLGVSEEELSCMEEEGFDTESVDEDGESVMEQLQKRAQEENSQQAAYEDKGQKAEDYKSSATALILVGAVGLVALVLLLLDLLPIHLYGVSRYMTGGVMGLLFVVFLVMGVSSQRMYQKYMVIAEEEKELVAQMKTCLADKAKAQQIDSCLTEVQDAEDVAQLYYKRIEIIKQLLTENFPQAEASLADKLADDWYGEQFETSKADNPEMGSEEE